MKRALFALITLTTAAFAAERPGVMFLENTDDYHMEPTGGNFAGQPVTKWGLDFPGRKFASASVTLKLEGGASSVYKEIRARLSEKYGTPTTEKKLSGGGKAVKAYNERRASFGSMSIWKFTPNMKEKETLTVVAELSDGKGNSTTTEEALTVTIRYVNDTLMPKAAEGGKATAPVKKEDL